MAEGKPTLPSCPICGKAAGEETLRPFCSRRCADVDLGRWLTGQYRIPGATEEADEAATDSSA
jgi:endogenous inhibitor of DNA gyrase (YacG/DUF329 family)